MTKQEYYLYCFECECDGEIPLSYEEVSPIKGFLFYLISILDDQFAYSTSFYSAVVVDVKVSK